MSEILIGMEDEAPDRNIVLDKTRAELVVVLPTPWAPLSHAIMHRR
ncbi:hypothetical protein [Streptomyces longwoodensis]